MSGQSLRRGKCVSATLLIAAALSACAGSLVGGPPSTDQPPQALEGYEGIDPDRLGAHANEFELVFESEDSWRYEIVTRFGESATERALRVEGVEDALNPGDVRMVTEGGVSRMIGPGTEGQCLQFPEDMGVNIPFLNPDDVLPPDSFEEPLVGMGREQIGGQPAEQYALVQSELDRWEEVQLGLWIAPASGAVMRYQFQATGWDPFFSGGWGRISGDFSVAEIGPQAVEPVTGCEVALPLPEEHRSLVVLPGVVAFETPLGLRAVTDFYLHQLQGTDWRRLSQEDRASGAVVLRYRQGPRSLDVTIRQMDDHTRVELLTEGP